VQAKLDQTGKGGPRAGGTGAAPSKSGKGLMGGLLTPQDAILIAIQGVAFVAIFHRFLLKQHEFSMEKPQDWGHAYIIPLISGFLIWRQRKEIAACPRKAYWPGLVPFIYGIMSYFYFAVAIPNHMLQGASAIITLFGLVLLNLGPQMMRFLFLPIVYLACGITISEMVMNYITFPLQLLASRGGNFLLNIIGAVFGFHSEVNGNTIEVISSRGTVPLNIAEACSGLRMLIAFLALACAVALISCKLWWQRIALIILAPVVALFMNVVRVAILGIGSIFDAGLAAGDAHMLIGTVLLVPSLMLFMGVVWVLNRVSETDGAVVGKKNEEKKTEQKKPAKGGAA